MNDDFDEIFKVDFRDLWVLNLKDINKNIAKMVKPKNVRKTVQK